MSECIAKSKSASLTVVMKEKYGPAKTYTDLTVIMSHDNSFYLVSREGTQAVLPKANWAITSLENGDPDEDSDS